MDDINFLVQRNLGPKILGQEYFGEKKLNVKEIGSKNILDLKENAVYLPDTLHTTPIYLQYTLLQSIDMAEVSRYVDGWGVPLLIWVVPLLICWLGQRL